VFGDGFHPEETNLKRATGFSACHALSSFDPGWGALRQMLDTP
jgi:hypothetical protein